MSRLRAALSAPGTVAIAPFAILLLFFTLMALLAPALAPLDPRANRCSRACARRAAWPAASRSGSARTNSVATC